MTTTLMQLRERLRKRYGVTAGDRFLDDPVLTEAINDGLAMLDSEQRWPWMELIGDVTATAGQGEYALPASYRSTRAMSVLVDDGSPRALIELAPAELVSAYPSNTRGLPKWWSVHGTSIYIGPTPDQTYTLQHFYYRATPDLVEDTDECLVPDQYVPALLASACMSLAEREGDAARRVTFEASYQGWVRRMRSALRRSTGPVVPRVRRGGWL